MLFRSKIDRTAFSANQHLAHGYAWIVTYIETLRETANWASRLEAEDQLGEIDALLAQILFSKYLRSEERRVGKECRSRGSPDH